MTATHDEIDALLAYMPIIIRAPDQSDWTRKFCASVIARTKRGRFTPSEKQVGVMRRMVEDFKAATRDDSLIERGQ